MAAVNVELAAGKENVDQPVIWRLARSFNVVTNIERARVSDDYAYVALRIEGSNAEVDQAVAYLNSAGVAKDSLPTPGFDALRPEASIPQPNAIFVRLSAVTPEQGKAPILYRVGKDFSVVVNIERASFDDNEGGSMDVLLSGPLTEIQRAIAYLHTTGIHVNPRQRSVTDFGNL